MILNKSAVERGLGHATMLKTEQIDLSKESGASKRDLHSSYSSGLDVHCVQSTSCIAPASYACNLCADSVNCVHAHLCALPWCICCRFL